MKLHISDILATDMGLKQSAVIGGQCWLNTPGGFVSMQSARAGSSSRCPGGSTGAVNHPAMQRHPEDRNVGQKVGAAPTALVLLGSCKLPSL